jgi:hypothetical protein
VAVAEGGGRKGEDPSSAGSSSRLVEARVQPRAPHVHVWRANPRTGLAEV